nr:MAG TPA: hypothetical protein [Caudoviricetes sp.]
MGKGILKEASFTFWYDASFNLFFTVTPGGGIKISKTFLIGQRRGASC